MKKSNEPLVRLPEHRKVKKGFRVYSAAITAAALIMGFGIILQLK